MKIKQILSIFKNKYNHASMQANIKVYSQNYDEDIVKIGWFTLDLA